MRGEKRKKYANLLVDEILPHHFFENQMMLNFCVVGLTDDGGQHFLPAEIMQS